MQSVFTFVIEAFTVTAFAFFSIAFITGFIRYERELHPVATVPDVDIDIEDVISGYKAYHKPQITDVVVPFQRPTVKPVEAQIDWKLWSVADLRSAKQRAAFNIPLRVGGKVLTKKQLVDFYTVALTNSFDCAATWSEADAA